MKTKLLAAVLLAGSSLLAGPRVFVGVGVGGYVAPPPVVAYGPPPCPGPGYAWVGGTGIRRAQAAWRPATGLGHRIRTLIG